MAKLEGVKTLDMIGGQITKVGYDGAIYERDRAFDGSTDIGNLLLCTDAPFTWFTKGAFYEVEFDTSAPVVDNVGSTSVILKTKFDIFRKVSESSTPTIEQVDALAERVTKLEGEKKDESTPKTVKRKARVGERILITDAGFAGGDPTYKNGDILTVKSVGDWGKDTVIAEEVEARKGPYIYDKEYEVIIEEESKPAPTFSEGDRVKALANGEYGDIAAGEIGIVSDIYVSETDPYTIGVETDEDHDYFRPQDIELVSEAKKKKRYEPTSGDIVVITGNTNSSRNEIGDIGKVGRVRLGNAEVDVIGKTEGNGNWTKFSEMRPATDEEKAEYERAAKFAKLGRKPGEFKKGDIVRLNQNSGADSEGTVVEIASDKARTYIGVDGDTYLSEAEWFELIAPVESRVDIDE